MTNSTGTRGPYAKTAKLRARAVDVGIELFGSAGYHGATLTQVADRLGMSLPGLLHHFPDKDTLLAAVLEERDRRARDRIPAGGMDAIEGLLHMLTDNQKTPGLMELHCVLAAEATSPEHPAHDYFRRRYASLRDEATAAFEAMAARGELNSSIDPSSLAATIIGVVDGLQLQWLLDRESIDLESAVRAFVRTAIPAVR